MATKKNTPAFTKGKTRTYILTQKATPITYQLRSRDTQYNPLQYYDGDALRALRYLSNQKEIFVDAQNDTLAILGTVLFEDGKLLVDAQNTTLQFFLLHHPDNEINGGSRFKEFDPESVAKNELDQMELQYDAIKTALEMDITDLEAIGRVIFKSKVDAMPTSELKRDVTLYARNNPAKFIELANDSDIRLRNLANRAVDLKIIGVKDDNTTIYWVDTKKVIVKLPFGSNPYTSLAQYFKTDEGAEVMEAIGVKLGK
jgi:hypothetical protein